MLERILVPLDGSQLSSRILKPVLRLAERTKAEVRAIRVLDGYEADQAMLRGEDPYGIAAAELARDLEPLEGSGIKIGYDSYVGDPASRILDDAETYRASLIAMATHGRSGVDRWIRGSVAERVLRRSPVPVFLANPRAIDGGLAVRKILVPLDGSETAARALPVAVAFARVFGAELVLLTVVEGDTIVPQVPKTTSGAAQKLLEGSAKKLEGLSVRTLVAGGSPALGILDAADQERADLIAMSTHGRSGISRWAFGSTAEDVVRHARSPLLVVRTSGARSRGETELEKAVANVL